MSKFITDNVCNDVRSIIFKYLNDLIISEKYSRSISEIDFLSDRAGFNEEYTLQLHNRVEFDVLALFSDLFPKGFDYDFYFMDKTADNGSINSGLELNENFTSLRIDSSYENETINEYLKPKLLLKYICLYNMRYKDGLYHIDEEDNIADNGCSEDELNYIWEETADLENSYIYNMIYNSIEKSYLNKLKKIDKFKKYIL